jgi:hypothetical protein
MRSPNGRLRSNVSSSDRRRHCQVRDTSENCMAVVAAIKAGELLQQGAIQAEVTAQKRRPGLQIVIVERDGSHQIAYQPPQMLDVAPVREAEPVPSFGIRDPNH